MSTQEALNARVWAACEAFRGDMPFTQCRDHALALIFFKYVSDVWHHQQAQDGAAPHNATGARFHLPQIEVHDASGAILIDCFRADIYKLHMRGDQPDIGALLDRAMAALEQVNQARFGDLFHCLRFSDDAVLDHGAQRNVRLRNFLLFLAYLEVRAHMAAYPALFMFLIERFALEDDGTPETPHQIARLLYHLAEPRPGEHIADPVCGSASLLLGATGHGVQYNLAGQEETHALWAIAVMNLLMHEQDNAIMKRGDSLNAPQLLNGAALQQFDVVLAYPPPKAGTWLAAHTMQDEYGRFARGMPPRMQAEFAWISHCLAMTRPASGRLAMITTARVLYRGGMEGTIRQCLIEENLLDTVILLPPNVLPHARVEMVLCLFDRAREAGGARSHVRDVLLIDASVGITPSRHLCLLSAGQIDQIMQDVNARQSQGQRCHLASRDEIAANDYDLNFPRYLFDREKQPVHDLAGEAQDIAEMEQTLLALQNKMKRQLAELAA